MGPERSQARRGMTEDQPIAPDPMKWIERLLDANMRSQFTSRQKIVIAHRLRELARDLSNPALSVEGLK